MKNVFSRRRDYDYVDALCLALYSLGKRFRSTSTPEKRGKFHTQISGISLVFGDPNFNSYLVLHIPCTNFQVVIAFL